MRAVLAALALSLLIAGCARGSGWPRLRLAAEARRSVERSSGSAARARRRWSGVLLARLVWSPAMPERPARLPPRAAALPGRLAGRLPCRSASLCRWERRQALVALRRLLTDPTGDSP
ncbi:MAG TPA: hypothetical protein RMH85_10425 [Polyangiaceae bacterium LLY-WYZ-15_(1-7)]|nr:hypothetical protein [Myxococcales bacterium]MAT29028.1 hypothetical protein [Sandaracinus sp.]HJL00158.1 hypothetical protein [Polyangiaceae bacterium LLY-WYZ-15_(1-7)]HJL08906.1 hypothetical protein [Polyangiaceae bacterium LLY-WYZ-15_(1-7)]HJL24839.1 hypothetical protein [Polyangiaceae bacterium LLY-WYZ-15_(1-7)]